MSGYTVTSSSVDVNGSNHPLSAPKMVFSGGCDVSLDSRNSAPLRLLLRHIQGSVRKSPEFRHAANSHPTLKCAINYYVPSEVQVEHSQYTSSAMPTNLWIAATELDWKGEYVGKSFHRLIQHIKSQPKGKLEQQQDLGSCGWGFSAMAY